MINGSSRVGKTPSALPLGDRFSFANGDLASIRVIRTGSLGPISSARASYIRALRVSELDQNASGLQDATDSSVLSIRASANEGFHPIRSDRERMRAAAKTRVSFETYEALRADRGKSQ